MIAVKFISDVYQDYRYDVERKRSSKTIVP